MTDDERKEQIRFRIEVLKKELQKTDYKTLKHAEGHLSDDEWQASNALRQGIRLEIEELDKQLDGE